MNSFLDKYQLPKLSQEQIDKLNRPLISKEIEKVINPKKPKMRCFKCRIYKDFQRRINTNTPQIVPQNRNRRNIAKLFLRGYSYPDTQTTQ